LKNVVTIVVPIGDDIKDAFQQLPQTDGRFMVNSTEMHRDYKMCSSQIII